MNTNWYVARDGKKQGPFSLAQMQKMAGDGQLLPIDMVLQEGSTQWMAASQVEAFFPGSGTAPPPLPIPVAEAKEWHLSQGGKQSGPVTMTDLKGLVGTGTLRPDDLVWKAGMPDWIAASTVQGLFPPPKDMPPPIPTTALIKSAPADTQLAKPETTGNASFELVFEPFTGVASGTDRVEVRLYFGSFHHLLIPITLSDGFRFKYPQQVSIGRHLIRLVPLVPVTGVKKLLFVFGKTHDESPSGERRYRVDFPTPGHYTVNFTYDDPRHECDFPANVSVIKEVASAEDVGLGGAARKAFSAIARGWKNMEESSRRSQLHGLWEPVNFSSQWFMFTNDNAMLRGDGFATKFRWLDDTKIELYADDTDKTVQFTVLSLGEFELILQTGDQSGHFKKGTTITQELRQIREEENRKRRAEAAANFKNVAFGTASVLAAGGFAALCCGVAVAAASGAGRCRCQWPIRHGNYCVNCGYML